MYYPCISLNRFDTVFEYSIMPLFQLTGSRRGARHMGYTVAVNGGLSFECSIGRLHGELWWVGPLHLLHKDRVALLVASRKVLCFRWLVICP